jgi:purine-binding chemotaxis protein CheW
MIADKQNLIFALHGSLYGISADLVREICWLPELYSLATAPSDIIGMFDWRSKLVPVMHLDLRFGRKFSGCRVTDRAIVVEHQSSYVAIVAHDVFDVQYLTPQQFDADLIRGRQIPAEHNFVAGIARLNEAPVICLDLERLIREPNAVDPVNEPIIASGADFYGRCCPDATPAEREVFATRASELKASISVIQAEAEQGVLAVQIGTEYIGIPLELVVDVDALERFWLSSVPLAPSYILGQTDWRGKVLPIIELGSVLQIPILARQEFVVIKIDDISIGVAVDRIFDVIYLPASQIEQLPLSTKDRMRKYCDGLAKYQDNSIYLVKIKELIDREFMPTPAAANR